MLRCGRIGCVCLGRHQSACFTVVALLVSGQNPSGKHVGRINPDSQNPTGHNTHGGLNPNGQNPSHNMARQVETPTPTKARKFQFIIKNTWCHISKIIANLIFMNVDGCKMIIKMVFDKIIADLSSNLSIFMNVMTLSLLT